MSDALWEQQGGHVAGEARRVQEMKSVENSDQLVLGSQTSAMM